MKPARLLIIRSTSTYGGAERQIVGFASRLDRHRFEPVICGFQDDLVTGNTFLDIAAKHGLETLLIPSRKGFDTGAIKALSGVVRDGGFQLLCPQEYRSNFYACIAGSRLGIPVVATAHGFTGHTRSVRLYENIDRALVLRGMNRVVCVSQAMVKRLRRCAIPASKLCRVYNSIETSPYTALATEGDRLRVCSVGRLSIEKGHRFLILAWPGVLKQYPTARLVIVGDGPERTNLENLALHLGIADSVQFVGFTDSPMAYVSDCDVFALPSLTEGLPVALLEACAAAKPVVASDVGGIGEVVSSGTSGILVRAGRPEELERAVLSLLESRQRRIDFGIAARKTVEDRFSFERNVPLLEQAYLPFVDQTCGR